jgi:hypothetical protein
MESKGPQKTLLGHLGTIQPDKRTIETLIPATTYWTAGSGP